MTQQRHVMPIHGEHVADPACWCHPRGEVVRDPVGVVVGTVWLHEQGRVEWAQGVECPLVGPAPRRSVLAMRGTQPHGGRSRCPSKGGGG